jgi:tRNA pseudouridine13 synthase
MKVKQLPEDFQVEELTDLVPTGSGPFALYRLEKRGWTTPDALRVIRQRWQLDRRRLSYGGLKDRHARTVQHLTILHGPRRQLSQEGITLKYLGQVAEPFTSRAIRANRFQIVLRSLSEQEATHAVEALEEVRRQGVPNYFDDQRFGSVSRGGDFVGRAMIQGRYEDALRLALASPYEHDRAAQKKEKAILRQHWGDWPACKALLPRGHSRSLVSYLADHPTDFRGTLERVRPELQGLYLSAYQSHLWNRMLARWLRDHCRPEQLVHLPLRLGEVPAYRELDDEQFRELAALQLPLPSARTKLDPADPRTLLLEAVLGEEGLRPEQLKLKGSRKPFFSKGERAALCLPAGLQWQAEIDELHPGRSKLRLTFELARGCYATLIIKRLQSVSRIPLRP